MQTDTAIKLVFMGDLLFGGEFIEPGRRHYRNFKNPFEFVEPHLNPNDILFLNLEGPIFRGRNKRKGVTSILHNDVSVLEFFRRRSICVLSLANNHIMDYEEEGLNVTLKILRENGIYYVGAGANSDEANKEVIIERNRTRIAFLAYTSDATSVGAVVATDRSSGCSSFADLDSVIEKVKKVKKNSDIVCVSLHWGYEYFKYPSNAQVKMAHSLADAGASYIIGHHPHVIQGIEQYKSSLIIYSLGNYFFPATRSIHGRIEPLKRISREFMVVKSQIDDRGEIGFNVFGGRMTKNYLLSPFDDRGQEVFYSNLKALSKPLKLPNYDRFWYIYRANREKQLIKESVTEAFIKIFSMSLKDLTRTLTLDDIKRNVIRVWKIIVSMVT
jgi:poly-gamma-glutamate capsule biosynthesis protein CapA/YwtB (metallophosphatase superfamily)